MQRYKEDKTCTLTLPQRQGSLFKLREESRRLSPSVRHLTIERNNNQDHCRVAHQQLPPDLNIIESTNGKRRPASSVDANTAKPANFENSRARCLINSTAVTSSDTRAKRSRWYSAIYVRVGRRKPNGTTAIPPRSLCGSRFGLRWRGRLDATSRVRSLPLSHCRSRVPAHP